MTCNKLQNSLDWCMGRPELPGIMNRIYYISKSKIKKWPTYSLLNNDMPIRSNYDGSFVFNPDTSLRYITVLGEKSQLTSEPQGEMPNQLQLNKLTVVYPSAGPEATELAMMLNNDDCVFIAQDMEGRYRVVGCKDYMTKVSVSQDNGQGTTGTVSTTIVIEAPDIVVAPFYTGDIEWLSRIEKMLVFDYQDMTEGQWGTAEVKDGYIEVSTELAGSTPLPRGGVVVSGNIPLSTLDHPLVVWRVKPPIMIDSGEPSLRGTDWEFRAHALGLEIVAAHNVYSTVVKLSDGTLLLVYELNDLTTNDYVLRGDTVFYAKFEIKAINITTPDGQTSCLPFSVYNMFAVDNLETLKWYVNNNLKLRYTQTA